MMLIPRPLAAGIVIYRRSLRTRKMRDIVLPAVIDIEASGFGRDSYPIEVGVVLPNGKGSCYLIKPASSWTYWDSKAELVHGISRDILMEKGQDPRQVATDLNDLLLGSKVYTDAWSYDLSWLGKLYDLADVTQLYTLESLRKLMSEQQSAKWHQTKEQVMREFNLKRHRASSDAKIIQETLKKLRLEL
jgi:hypothetical protein